MDLPQIIQRHLSALDYFTETGIPVVRDTQENVLDALEQALALTRGMLVMVQSTDGTNTTQQGTPGQVQGTETITIEVMEHVSLNRSAGGNGTGIAGAYVARAIMAGLHLARPRNGPDAVQQVLPVIMRFVRRATTAQRVQFAEGADPVTVEVHTLTFEAPNHPLCTSEDLKPAYHAALMAEAAGVQGAGI